jgi:putative endonuclease
MLVWYEAFDELQEARACELRMKKWKRSWKLRLIEERNPDWRDLYNDIA